MPGGVISKPLPNPRFLLYFLSIIKSVSVASCFQPKHPKSTQSRTMNSNLWYWAKLNNSLPFICSLCYIGHRYGKLSNTEALDWSLFMYAVLLGRCLMALVSPAYSGLDFNPSFTCTALHMASPRSPRAFSQGLPWHMLPALNGSPKH